MSHDVLVVGSSPALLASALLRQRSGETITMVEAADTVGGAWSTTQIDGLQVVERACHMMQPDQRVYDWIESDLGVDLVDYVVSPRVRVGPFTFPTASRVELWLEMLSFPIFLAYCATKALRTPARRDRLRVEWNESKYRAGRLAARVRGGALWHRGHPRQFADGVDGCLRSLVTAFEAAGGTLLLQTPVERIDVDTELGMAATTISGQQQLFDEVVVSSGLAGCDLHVDGHKLVKSVATFPNTHLLLRVSGTVEPLSYVRFVGDRTLRRVSTVDAVRPRSITSPGADDEATLLLVQTRSGIDPAKAMARLRDRGIVADDVALDLVRTFQYESHDIHVSSITDPIAKQCRALTLVETRGDLIHNLRAVAAAA